MDRRFSREIARLEVGGPFRKRNVGGGSRIGEFGGGGGGGGGGARGSEKKSPDLKSAEVGISVF